MINRFRNHLRIEALRKVAEDLSDHPSPYPDRSAWLEMRLKHPIGHWFLENLIQFSIATNPHLRRLLP